MTHPLLELCYLAGSITFILGLKLMGHPRTARRGNFIGALGMGVAIFGTIFFRERPLSPVVAGWLFAALALGTAIGWITARRVRMTQMPELVSMFNGMGGACAVVIGLMEYPNCLGESGPRLAVLAGIVIGSISFSGSLVAFLKLNGTLGRPLRLPSYNFLNTVELIGVIALAYWLWQAGPAPFPLLYILLAAALLYGVLFTVPIGGADMPVVISLLNSFTGLAAAFGGFLYSNYAMLTGGILVGSAGTLLTLAMCKAMNRPLSNVVFGAFGASSNAAAAGATQARGAIKDIQAGELAVLLNYSQRVVIVPGYGLAVAQAQHVIHELESLLERRGVQVKYAIHPVAGRMPGHMNVLLAEANVAYEKLVEMEEINPEFERTDVVLVIGANDVVNPAARTSASSPIYGMPILDADKARRIIVNKRSMNAGYAGIDNEIFYHPNCSMFFGDAKQALSDLLAELKSIS
jgi:NAD(P) transhydrogenase subunit beta